MESSFMYRIFMLILVLLCGFILTVSVFLAILFIQSGFDMVLVRTLFAQMNTDVYLLRLMLFLQSLFVFILPPFLFCWLFKEKRREFLHLEKPRLSSVLIAILSIVWMIPLINLLVKWNAGIHLPESLHGVEVWMRASEDDAMQVTNLLMKGTTWSDLGNNLLIIGLMAGLGEELFFRGALQSLLSKKLGPGNCLNKKPDWVMHTSIWLVAFIFSAIHFQFYGFIPRLLLGAWFGYLLWWTGSIWVPILGHIINNSLSTLFAYAQNKGMMVKDPDSIGLNESWWLCLISIVLLWGCIVYFRRRMKTQI